MTEIKITLDADTIAEAVRGVLDEWQAKAEAEGICHPGEKLWPAMQRLKRENDELRSRMDAI